MRRFGACQGKFSVPPSAPSLGFLVVCCLASPMPARKSGRTRPGPCALPASWPARCPTLCLRVPAGCLFLCASSGGLPLQPASRTRARRASNPNKLLSFLILSVLPRCVVLDEMFAVLEPGTEPWFSQPRCRGPVRVICEPCWSVPVATLSPFPACDLVGWWPKVPRLLRIQPCSRGTVVELQLRQPKKETRSRWRKAAGSTRFPEAHRLLSRVVCCKHCLHVHAAFSRSEMHVCMTGGAW
ncbi:uncharacterized protein LOC120849947 [Ixodes scapularis]|uniref:uncharacterized protein LOC120849947 n=1 Tax=Ixodes scapularis TaxID=6945 RepID=UPI001A9F5594|nr:uncharacterized protein LOC120849947 [Ixodes scapularis]